MQLRSLTRSSHSPQAKPELLHTFGMMKDCFTHPTMYAEYSQAGLWSHNILLPTLSLQILMKDIMEVDIQAGVHTKH